MILVPFDMPKSCSKCPFSDKFYGEIFCMVLSDTPPDLVSIEDIGRDLDGQDLENHRYSGCPLKEVKV